MSPDAIMIFAAGLGTRMGALTQTRPKPLIEVAGRPLLDHALDLARGAGLGRIVVNTHAHAGQMQDWLTANAPDVRISHEPERLETGGGLRRALPLLGGETAFTLNADTVWHGPNPLPLLAAAWDPARMDALLCLVPRQDVVGHAGPGDFFLESDGRLRRRSEAAAADFVYQGEKLAPIVEAFDVSRLARRRMLENFAFAAVYNLFAAPLAAFGFVTPLIAALAMSSSSIIVTLNALRLAKAQPRKR